MANPFGQCPMTDDYLQPCNVRLILYFILLKLSKILVFYFYGDLYTGP